jgi:hypothetical protein
VTTAAKVTNAVGLFDDLFPAVGQAAQQAQGRGDIARACSAIFNLLKDPTGVEGAVHAGQEDQHGQLVEPRLHRPVDRRADRGGGDQRRLADRLEGGAGWGSPSAS